MAGQIPLNLGLRPGATFSLFEPGGNRPLMAGLIDPGQPFVYLFGPAGSGKSHLLQAACHHYSDAGEPPVYLPLARLVAEGTVAMLQGLEALALICLDDIEAVAGNDAWERALFDLYNRCRSEGARLVAAAEAPPAALPLRLPDLRSRLTWGPVYQIHELDETGKIAALRLHAEGRGLELPEEVGNWLLRHCARDMHSLVALIERLDRASLVAKRRLTLPFVREVLEGGS